MGRPGNPTLYRAVYVEQVRKLCALGATDDAIADFFNVDSRTVQNWREAHPAFAQACAEAKAAHDMLVERALFERATGYEHPAVQIFCDKGDVTEVPYTKRYPPDPVSMIFWLKNRQPARWRELLNVNLAAGVTFNINTRPPQLEAPKQEEPKIVNGARVRLTLGNGGTT